jgi:RimJ/RimL family protein N-acetyltransferase
MPELLERLVFFHAQARKSMKSEKETGLRIVDNVRHMPAPPPELASFMDVYHRRFESGHLLLAAEDEGRGVFQAWVASGRLRIDELRRVWVIPERERVMYDVFTAPAYRGRGLYSNALRYLLSSAAILHAERFWIYARSDNTASIRVIRRCGFTEAGTLYGIHVLRSIVFPELRGLHLCKE